MKLIDGKLYYTPREAAELQLLRKKNGGNPVKNWQTVHRLINSGELDRETYGEKDYSLISYEHIEKYNKKIKRKGNDGKATG